MIIPRSLDADRILPLRYGAPAPNFALPSTSGTTVSLAGLRGQDVVLLFYCFDWGSI